MLVTATAIYGKNLERMKADLHEQGVIYSPELTTATNVLIAGIGGGVKCRVAKDKGIPCVTSAWVRLGRCSRSRVDEFEMGRSLLGLEVCSTSLSMDERNFVRRACEAHQGIYNPFLTRMCSLLVKPNEESILNENAKVLFAKKNHIDVMSFDKFMKQYGFVLQGPSKALLAIPQQTFGDGLKLMIYFSPRNLLTKTVSSFPSIIGARHVPVLTALTTHVVVLGPTEEVFSPRPGLEFVSLAWLEECVAQQKYLSVEPYRVSVTHRPIITFTGVSLAERMTLCSHLEVAGLPCLVQEEFILGRMADGSDGKHNTTHLVVESSSVVESFKIAALSWRVHKQQCKECFLVDMEWVRQSLQAGYWLDCAKFCYEVPQVAALKKKVGEEETHEVIVADEVEEVHKHEEMLSPCFLPNELQDEAIPSRSLEMMIETLESRTTASPGGGIVCKTLIISAPPPLSAARSLSKEKIGSDVCAGSHFDSPPPPPAASVSVEVCRSPVPIDSQIIVYKRCETEYTRMVPNHHQEHREQHKQQQGQLSTVPSFADEPAIANSSSITEGCVHEVVETPKRPSNRHCCIMMAKSLTYVDEDLRRLQELGCTLATTVEECTHYVTGKPSKTEFFLSTVAGGKWVLAPSFLDETLRKNRIASEEAHEWCPELARAAQFRNSMVELVRACRLQRQRTLRVFASWRVALCCSTTARAESFFRVLQSGGCTAIFPYTPSQLLGALKSDPETIKGMSFVLSDDNMWDVSGLDALGAYLPVLKMEYVAHCLCVETPEPDLYSVRGDDGHPRKRSRIV